MHVALEISVYDAQAQLSQESAKPILLDVREPMEIRLCRIDGAIHIPLRQLEHSLEALPRDENFLIYCHHGRRSLLAANYLMNKGFKAKSIMGGIDAWADQIDPSLRRY